jgi:WD40 repeat protein
MSSISLSLKLFVFIFINLFSKNGNLFCSGGWGSDVVLWSNPQQKVGTKIVGHTDTITSVDISPDSKFIARYPFQLYYILHLLYILFVIFDYSEIIIITIIKLLATFSF